MTLDTHPILDVEHRLGGAGPFVINLHASTAPIGLPAKSPAGNEHARLYQIQRVDDGRIRFRLRLGPFATEDEAEVALAQARLDYPGALMVTAAADDLHAIALARGKANSGGSSAGTQTTDVIPQAVVDTRPYTPPMTAVTPATAPAMALPAPARAVVVAAPAPAVAAPVRAAVVPAPAVAAPVRAVAVPAPAVAAAPKPAIAVAAPVPRVAAPIPAVAAAVPQRAAVSVASDIASMQALIAAIDSDVDNTSNKVTAKPPVLHTVPAAKVTVRRDEAHAGTTVPSLESTQTLRPLTPLELGEHEAPRWFVVQLALSDDAFDPDALPDLDIFSLYRLYTVIGMDQGRLVHALRLGFFGEEVGARAVSSYLSAFYDEPIVKRVSVAERDRFADQRVEARKDVGATGRHLAIEITNELVVRGRRSSL